MADTTTAALGLTKPAINDTGGANAWGTKLNADMDLIDAAILGMPDGCCRLSVTSTTALKLSPFNGSALIINGVLQQIPSAGVSYTASGLAASTKYYVYAYMNAGVMTLELSTTAYTLDAFGRANKTGDATRRLIGMVGTNSSNQFADGLTQRLCLNWFNRRGLSLAISVSGATTPSTTPVYLSGITLSFLTWGDENFSGGIEGFQTQSSANVINFTAYAVDGAGVGIYQYFQPYAAGAYGGVGIPYNTTLTEGLHTTTGVVYINSSSGTGTWNLLHTATVRG